MPDTSLAADILRGIAQIAEFIGLSERQAYYACETGRVPAIKEGRIWVSTRSRLIEHYNKSTFTPPPPKTEPSTPIPRRMKRRVTRDSMVTRRPIKSAKRG